LSASDHLRGTVPNDARDELGLVAAHRKIHGVEDVLEVFHEEIVIADARRHEARDELALVAALWHAELLAVVAQLFQPEDLEVLRGDSDMFPSAFRKMF
jgi:septum formation topological specificity factor MinE